MSTQRDGGPAFPQHVAPAYRQEPEIWGMSLRDWFAGQALAAMRVAAPYSECTVGYRRDVASRAYQYADAMLAERAKGQDQP